MFNSLNKRKFTYFVVFLLLTVTACMSFIYLKTKLSNKQNVSLNPVQPSEYIVSKPNPTTETAPTPALKQLPQEKVLPTSYHIYQTFNNCGPASLSMTLRFYGINVSQQELGNKLRPYQVANGNNDDKSVTLQELAKVGESYGFIALHRPSGNKDIIMQFINYDIPVITRTWLKPNDDIGHYRVVKGFNQNKDVFIQDDSLQGKNLEYSYKDFNDIWEKFNYEYLVLVPKDKEDIAKQIMGDNFSKDTAWKNSVAQLEQKLQNGDSTVTIKFNLVVALVNIGEYSKAIKLFEEIEPELPPRALWYNAEPIYAYYKLGEYDKALQIIDTILNNDNRAFSELYIIKGDIYKDNVDLGKAKEQYELAIRYNQNLQEAKDRLNSVK